MDYVNFENSYLNEKNGLNSRLASLNDLKEKQLQLLFSLLDGNKDIFGRGVDGVKKDLLNAPNDIKVLGKVFNYLNSSLRYARVRADRLSAIDNFFNDCYNKLVDVYSKISDTNEKLEKLGDSRKSGFTDEELSPSVEYINEVSEVSNRIGEKRNKIAIIENYIMHYDSEDFMKEDHRKMIEALEKDISLDMQELCNLLASKGLDADGYRNFRSNVRFNLANSADTQLELTDVKYDAIYSEHENVNNLLRNVNNESLSTTESEQEANQNSTPASEEAAEEQGLNSSPTSASDEDGNLENSSEEEEEEQERNPSKNSPLSQFKDRFKHAVKGISTAGSKLRENIDTKVLGKSALRWIGVVGVLAVAYVINPALLFGGAAVTAGVYEYNVAKKMK